ncbi:unnamed protein product [Nyctereutes procyonoides]|uniref:ubiquitinyl hydrolase 1 n=1 Tax=Nyctereutes procyonoides TaxID=34880 RepID=A0A811YR45_NYCPR|nr:unnamed protein product [Nyctereutes procyonoides]
MESIFHEKQEGSLCSLCAQLCLNNLLQGEYFIPVELSSVAHQLDEEERMRIAEARVTSEEYHTGLELILFNSLEYQRLRIDPTNERSFKIRETVVQHEFSLGPELASDTYLALFLAQSQQQDCKADQLLQMIRVQQMQRPKLIGEELAQLKEQRVWRTDLERVLEANDGSGMLDEDEEDLQRALALICSSRRVSQDIPQTSGTHLTLQELWKRRKQQQDPPGQSSHPCERPTTSSEALGNLLQAAVTMSLETLEIVSKQKGKNNTFYKSFRCSYFPTLLSVWSQHRGSALVMCQRSDVQQRR